MPILCHHAPQHYEIYRLIVNLAERMLGVYKAALLVCVQVPAQNGEDIRI